MRFIRPLGCGVVVLAIGLAGCAKKPEEAPASAPPAIPTTAPLVAAPERSAHFDAVNRHLELGGTLYGYVDIDGDVLKLATVLRQFVVQAAAQQPQAAAFIPKDFGPIFQDLGLTDVTALGLSSVQAADGTFRNRVFIATPNGRRGLLAGLGGPPAPFAAPLVAPADADFVFESELDTPAVYSAVRAVVARLVGEPAAGFFESKLKAPDPKTGLAPLDVINALKGRACIVAKVDETRSFQATPELTLPAFDLLVRIEGVGRVLEPVIAKLPGIKKTTTPAGVTIYTSNEVMPKIEWTPELRIEGDVLTLATSATVGAAGGEKLANNPVFKQALAALGETGNGLTYVSPSLTARMQRITTLNPLLEASQQQTLAFVLTLLPRGDAPLVSVRQNLPDGVLIRSHWGASHKANLMFANPGVVVTTGLVAAMAIPAFQKVRATSQQKAVMNNLRQLAAAADQYFLETGKKVCGYRDLVGNGPNQYIRSLSPVAGEDYTKMLFRQGQAQISVLLPDGSTVTYDWNP
jgi:type IV pilus assembly protein PilA